MRSTLVKVAVAMWMLGAGAVSVAAQDATPMPLTAESCTVDPVDPKTYIAEAMAATPAPNTPARVEGKPADEATVAAVTETMRQSIACTNAGDIGRLLTLTDPSYAPILLSIAPGQLPAVVEAAAAGSARPVSIATPYTDASGTPLPLTSLVSVENVMMDIVDLPDGYYNGQVVATVTIGRPGIGVVTATVYLLEHNGQYRITNYYYGNTTPAEATPAA
ncbi:MAG: hypothetical protein WBA46_18600 [Thermomicrobiales bacterium]